MSFQKAKEHLRKCGYEDRIITFTELTGTVEQASNTLGCTKGEIAKTLAFLVGDRAIVIVTEGNAKINNSKYKQEFGVKAKMINFNEVEVLIGHAVGGVCPFGLNEGVEIYLDISLKKYSVLYPACGDSHSAVKLCPDEFEKIVNIKKWVDVCCLPE